MGQENQQGSTLENDIVKAEKKRKEQERQVRFDLGRTSNPEYKMQSGSKRFSDVDRNLALARDLEHRARTQDWTGQDRNQHNIGFKNSNININLREAMMPFGRALTEMQKLSYRSQAEHLRKGGKPVYDKYENYQGVVHKNWLGHTAYSGRIGFNPLGRSDVTYDATSGTYTSSFKDENQGGGGSEENNVNTGSNVTATNRTDSQIGMSPSTRKSLLANNISGSGDARQRLLLGRRKLS